MRKTILSPCFATARSTLRKSAPHLRSRYERAVGRTKCRAKRNAAPAPNVWQTDTSSAPRSVPYVYPATAWKPNSGRHSTDDAVYSARKYSGPRYPASCTSASARSISRCQAAAVSLSG